MTKPDDDRWEEPKEPGKRKRANTAGFHERPTETPAIPKLQGNSAPANSPVAQGPPPFPTRDTLRIFALEQEQTALQAQLAEAQSLLEAERTKSAFQQERAMRLLVLLSKNQLGVEEAHVFAEALLALRVCVLANPARAEAALLMHPELRNTLFALLRHLGA